MHSKLTLRIEERLIRQAKRQARAKGTSVSALVANYLSALASEEGDATLTPRVQRLRGVLHDTTAGREAHRRHLLEKYRT